MGGIDVEEKGNIVVLEVNIMNRKRLQSTYLALVCLLT